MYEKYDPPTGNELRIRTRGYHEIAFVVEDTFRKTALAGYAPTSDIPEIVEALLEAHSESLSVRGRCGVVTEVAYEGTTDVALEPVSTWLS